MSAGQRDGATGGGASCVLSGTARHGGKVLELNPALDWTACARAYARDGHVRIPHVLTPGAADHVGDILARQTPWRLTICSPDGPRPRFYDAAALRAARPEDIAAEVAAGAARARDGFSYVYLSYPMIDAYLEGWDPGHPIHPVSDFINGRPFLELCRAITGEPTICKADAQATLYRPGDFLAVHDDGPIAGRICAYTLGFTRGWRADWGGQLLFHDLNGDIDHGFGPAFNTLTLFKVPRVHSVAPVAAYAAASRLSIVGWARNDRKA
jgi:SM-20-related protein